MKTSVGYRESGTEPYRRSGCWALIAACCLSIPGIAMSEERGAPGKAIVSDKQIEEALANKPRTRGLTIRATAETRNVIDLNIPFELNSSELQKQAVAQLEQLESALKSGALARDRFMLAGHTDANGSAEHNRQLSLRRAESVKRFLVTHGVNPDRLEAAGFGADKLLTPEAPGNQANRRVEIRNLGENP